MKTINKINEQIIHFSELPFYLTIKKLTNYDTNTVKIVIESKIHVNKIVEMPTLFSIDYVRSEPNAFRSHILSFVVKRYGLHPAPMKYI